jgi:hypothetical protein
VRARTRWAVLAISALGTSALVDACSVSPSGDCSENGTCPRPLVADGGVDGGMDTGIEASVTPDTGITTPDAPVRDASDGPGCDATRDPKDEPCLVDEAYGIFVAPLSAGGNDQGGDGTKARPFATIGKALRTLSGKTRVYVCNGTYAEALNVTVAANIYGGFVCPAADAGPQWAYVGGAARVNAPAADYAIKVDGVSSAIAIEDLAFTSADAQGADAQGTAKSSVAALVNGSIVTLKRVALMAGSGADGSAGVDGAGAPNYSGAVAPNGSPGTTVLDGGSGSGPGGSNACANGATSNGGNGGGASGSDGLPGASSPPALTMAGQDGSGGKGGATICGMGASPGANGAAGASGAAASTYGQLSASGWVPSIGGDGQAGMPGQGGGGGGGLSGVSIGGNGIGAGGDGGGAGGCGGAGGTGGKGGGGSIALASVGSTVILVQCQLTTSGAGNGGAGGSGENGQTGGSYTSNMLSCPGAPGGSGAGGSGGAGGTGGISVGILYSGTPPSYDGFTTITVGIAGARGMRGTHGTGGTAPIGRPNAGNDGEDGLPGTAQATLAL